MDRIATQDSAVIRLLQAEWNRMTRATPGAFYAAPWQIAALKRAAVSGSWPLPTMVGCDALLAAARSGWKMPTEPRAA